MYSLHLLIVDIKKLFSCHYKTLSIIWFIAFAAKVDGQKLPKTTTEIPKDSSEVFTYVNPDGKSVPIPDLLPQYSMNHPNH